MTQAPVDPAPGAGRAPARTGLGAFLVAGGVVWALTAALAVVAAVVLSSSSDVAATSTFGAGQTVVAPEPDGVRGPLVVYGQDVPVRGSRTLAAGCEVVSPRGGERIVTSARGADPITVDGVDLVPLVQTSGWRPGDSVTCSGEGASALAPFAAVPTGAPGTARAVAVALAVLGALGAAVFLVGGAAVLRRRRS